MPDSDLPDHLTPNTNHQGGIGRTESEMRVDQKAVREWADLIIDNYGAGWRVVGVLEAARAHQELSPSFWEAVLARVMNKSGEKARAA